MKRLRVVAVTHRVPYPPNKGEKIRAFGLLSRLAREHEVHLFALADPPGDTEHADALRDAGFASVTLEPIRMPLRKALSLGVVASPVPMTLSAFFSLRLLREIARAGRGLGFDAALLESSSTAPYSRALVRGVPWIMDLVDVDSAKWAAYARGEGQGAVPGDARALARVSALARRAIFWREAVTLRGTERRIVSRAFATIVTTDREASLLRPIAARGRIEVLPNGVDTEKYAPRAGPLASDAPPRVVFFGAMDYDANVDAVCWFVSEILPRIRRDEPRAQLVIAGSNPTERVRALARPGEIEVTGFLDDIRPTVQSAHVCVVPLRVARGIQNKMLEAMAMGVPIVTTSTAAGGIDGRSGGELRIADSPADIAAEVLELLHHEDAATAQARRAHAFVVSHYGWAPRAARLAELLGEAASAPSRLR